MTNVLSIVTYQIFPPKLGGQKGIALFNQYFSKKVNLYCYTIADNDTLMADYTVFNEMENGKLRYINPFNFARLKKIIKKNHISHVLIEHPYYGWMGLLLKKFCKVKVIVHSHNIESERFRTVGKWWWKILWYYEKWIHHQTDFTFCITARDQNYFKEQYHLPSEKSAVITYGISWDTYPSVDEKKVAKSNLLKRYSLSSGTCLFLFNGTLNYEPNLIAVKNIAEKINPLFLKKQIPYKIIICGKGLPDELNDLKKYASQNIIYAGFVNDITEYFKGADVFINPVTEGGGIKTKLVEALGYNMNAVSTVDGAIGVKEKLCNGKLYLTPNEDWQMFADKMEISLSNFNNISSGYFDHFYWNNIAEKAAGIIENLK